MNGLTQKERYNMEDLLEIVRIAAGSGKWLPVG